MSPSTCTMSLGSSIAEPPYFTTTVFPRILLIHGSASVRTSAFLWASSSSPSSRPCMRTSCLGFLSVVGPRRARPGVVGA